MNSNNVPVGATTVRQGLPVLAVTLLATLVVTLDNTVLNVALPSIARSLQAGTSDLQWIVNAYSLLFGGLLLTGGALADRIGRRRVLVGGLVAFGCASGLVLLVHSSAALIGLRALTGAAAAFLMPSALAILYRAFTGPARAAAIGLWGAIAAVGFVAGPLVGGALLEHFAWQSVFVVNLPVAAVAIPLTLKAVPASPGRREGRADLVGTALSVTTMVAFVFALVSAPDHGWTSPRVLLGALAAIAAGAAFARWELRTADPMIDVRMAVRPAVAGPGATQGALLFAVGGGLFLITQQFQLVAGYGPLEAGLRGAPAALGAIAGAPLVAWAARRLSPAAGAAAGLVACGAGLAAMAAGARHGYAPLAAGLVLLGLGLRTAMTPAAVAVLDGLPERAAGMGSALNDTFQELGSALGVALMGSVFNAAYRDALPATAPGTARDSLAGALSLHDGALAQAARGAFESGLSLALWLCAAVMLSTALLALRTLPGRVVTPPARPAPTGR